MDSLDKIIYVAPNLSSFVKGDINMLSNHYCVTTNIYSWKNKKLSIIYLIKQIFFFLKRIKKVKVIIVSFGGYWSFIPSLIGKIFKTPILIILNGTDCASIPNLNYGSLRKPILKYVCKKSYQFADTLLPVSSSLIKIKNTYYSNDKYSFQGYQHFFPKIKTPAVVIHNGIDTDFWQQDNKIIKQEKTFISVLSSSQYILKGGNLILAIAIKNPSCFFYIAGCEQPKHIKSIPNNLCFLGKIKAEKLRTYFSKSQFYIQLSIFEGFGVALCEAMSCGCIPIGSNVNIIPDIIGNSGFIVENKEEKSIQKIIKKALLVDDKNIYQKKARNQIINNYHINKRKELLFNVITKHE
jgi:glycosyltransferase involved in cell wall biosynthesis